MNVENSDGPGSVLPNNVVIQGDEMQMLLLQKASKSG